MYTLLSQNYVQSSRVGRLADSWRQITGLLQEPSQICNQADWGQQESSFLRPIPEHSHSFHWM